jgi:hypothetical protein
VFASSLLAVACPVAANPEAEQEVQQVDG